MSPPPAVRPETQEAYRSDSVGSESKKNWPGRVQIVNPHANRHDVIRGRDARHLVAVGRADRVAFDQIRMIGEHPANKELAKKIEAADEALVIPASMQRLPLAAKTWGHLQREGFNHKDRVCRGYNPAARMARK